MTFNLSVSNENYVTTGDTFRIYHKISEGYLSVSESQMIYDEEFQDNAPEFKVFVQKGNKTSNSL